MSRIVCRSITALVVLAVGLVSMASEIHGQSATRNRLSARTSGKSDKSTSNGTAVHSTKNGEWPHYTGDLTGARYSPLDQINAENFNKLEVAWRFKTDNLGTRPEFKLEGTPLVINGILYATAGTRRSVVALKADTGEMMWVHAEFEGPRATAAPRQLSGRGLSYWIDGRADDRLPY